MKKLVLLVFALMWPLAVASEISVKHPQRELQWVFRETLGDGSKVPTAIFLSWNYDAVIFTATCDQARRELFVRYFAPIKLSKNDAALWIGTVRLRTTRDGNTLEGRAQLTPPLEAILRNPIEIDIGAPNEMDEPWHVGYAEPLRRIALSCH